MSHRWHWLGFINFPVPKGKLGDLILNTYKVAGAPVTVETLDKLKELGFQTAFQAGISIGIDDMIIPESKKDIVAAARKEIDEVENQYKRGIITTGERYNKIIDIWTGATDQIAKAVFSKLETKEGKRIRVRAGPFATKAEAERAAEKCKKLDLPGAVLSL